MEQIKKQNAAAWQIQFYLVLAVVATLPLSVALNRITLIALAVVSVAIFDWKALPGHFRERKRVFIVTLILAVNIVGLLYSYDVKAGLDLVERSLVSLAMPLIFLLFPQIDKNQIRKIVYFFCWVCFLLAIYCLLVATYRIYETGSLINLSKTSDREYYFLMNAELTRSAIGLSPIYFGLYLNFCIAFLLSTRIFGQFSKSRYDIVLLVILHSFQLLVFSLNSVFALLAIWLFILFFYIKANRVFDTWKITVTVVLLGLCMFAMYSITPLRERLFVNLQYDFHKAHISYWNGVSLRLAIWNCAWETIKKEPILGYGTGDANLALLETYRDKGFSLAENLEYNSHSQYLQSYLMHGVPGLVVLLTITGIPAYRAYKEKNYFLLLFLLIAWLGFLSEVLLSLQKGIFFYCIFFTLLYLPGRNENLHNNRIV